MQWYVYYKITIDYTNRLCGRPVYATRQDLYIKKSNQFSSIHFIKANEITSHDSGQPRTVSSSYKYAVAKKDEKADAF